jgi:hypothetical protein
LRIQDVYPGSEFFSSRIQDPNFFHRGFAVSISGPTAVNFFYLPCPLSLTSGNPDAKLLEEKTQMIEQTAAQLQEKEKLLAEKERKLESERKRAEQE